ncbi:MAG: LuxR C-terminal-related transcriptional regulator [Desulfobacterales bacterium]
MKDYEKTGRQLICENRKLKRQLDEVEKKYKLFADNVSDVIWMFDFNAEKFTFISPSIRHLLGYCPERAMDLEWEDIIIVEERTKFRRFMADILSLLKNCDRPQDSPFKLEVGQRHESGRTVWVELKARFLFNEKDEPSLILGVSREITDRKAAEEKLRKAYQELEETVEQRTAHLHEANIALKVLLEKRDADKAELEEKVALNLRNLVLPTLEKLRKISPKKRQKAYLDILENNIEHIMSPLMQKLSTYHLSLSPMEIQVADLITQGKVNKEIADILNLSLRTIEFHRRNIRAKLGITHKKVNLRTFLRSVQ